jgi:hypothetical protein
MMSDAIQRLSSFNVIHIPTMFKVDVFILKRRSFDHVQFQRRISQVFASDPETRAYTTTAEDIVLAKLEWYRMGGEVSDRQWRDILGVLKVQSGRLDLKYLQHWAGELRVVDLLEHALRMLFKCWFTRSLAAAASCEPGGMLFWAETSKALPIPTAWEDGAESQTKDHPFNTALQALQRTWDGEAGIALLRLPTTRSGPQPSPG